MDRVLLLVYGSLKTRLADYWVGDTTIKGDLYKVSWFPGIINVGNSEEEVEVSVHNIPIGLLSELDRYEGVPHLYVRKLVATKFGPAYIYEYNRPVERMERIKKWEEQ